MFITREDIAIHEVYTHLQADLVAAGFKAVYPSLGNPLVSGGVGTFVVESTDEVNPLNDTQKYRIRVHAEGISEGSSGAQKSWMSVNIASHQHISESGELSYYPILTGSSATSKPFPTSIGALGVLDEPGQSPTGVNPENLLATLPGHVFIARGYGESSNPNDFKRFTDAYEDSGKAVRYSYTLSVGDHGVAFYVWESTREAGTLGIVGEKLKVTEGTLNPQLRPKFSMFCVQSPVDKDTGEPLLEDKSPIFCVFNCDNTGFRKYVVNESDVQTATFPVWAGEDSVDSAAILNEEEQVAVKLDNKYLITFPNRVNTERFAYSEELDMIAYSSARVVGEDTVLELNVYNEGEPRRYRAMKANKANNQGMRLFVVQNGAGVDDTDHIAGGGNSGDGGTVDEGSSEP